MIDRGKSALFLAALVLLLGGCETAKGFSRGMAATAYGIGATARYTADGLVKDTATGDTNLKGMVNSVDTWIKDNMW